MLKNWLKVLRLLLLHLDLQPIFQHRNLQVKHNPLYELKPQHEFHEVGYQCCDFKSNEYANLIGGKLYEPEEENPMLGFRGASRYVSDK
jgi:hypothetical protein